MTTDQDEEIIEQQEQDEGTPEPAQRKIAEPKQNVGTGLIAAAEQVPMQRGVYAPATLADQITYAQTMARALASLPKHLQNAPGDCLAVIDIAQHAGLSPFMVANHTYKPRDSDRMAFDSQLFHALLIQSRRLKDAALHVEYSGEGDQRKCKVWGTLIGEDHPRYLESKTLAEMHPGHTHKDGRKYVKGSPLWDDKPDVQMFYDTSRDWTRLFCPIATMGMLDRYEHREYPINAAAEEPAGNGLIKRLQTADRSEGHNAEQAHSELANIASDKDRGVAPGAATEEKPAKGKRGKKAKPEKKPAKAAEPVKEQLPPKQEPKPKPAAKTPEPKPGQQTDDPPKAVPTNPKNAADYQIYAIDWIEKASDPEKALARWDQEYDLRRACSLPVRTANALRERLETRHGV